MSVLAAVSGVSSVESTFEEEHAETRSIAKTSTATLSSRLRNWSIFGLHSALRRRPSKALISLNLFYETVPDGGLISVALSVNLENFEENISIWSLPEPNFRRVTEVLIDPELILIDLDDKGAPH
jgi:hypothetical protein